MNTCKIYNPITTNQTGDKTVSSVCSTQNSQGVNELKVSKNRVWQGSWGSPPVVWVISVQENPQGTILLSRFPAHWVSQPGYEWSRRKLDEVNDNIKLADSHQATYLCVAELCEDWYIWCCPLDLENYPDHQGVTGRRICSWLLIPAFGECIVQLTKMWVKCIHVCPEKRVRV